MLRRTMLACTLAVAFVAPRSGVAAPPPGVTVREFAFTALGVGTVLGIDAKGNVRVTGAEAGAQLVVDARPGTRLSLGMRHVDPGTSSLRIDYEGFWPAPLGHMKTQPLRPWGGKITLARTGGGATIGATFRSATTYSIRVTRDGAIIDDLTGRVASYTIRDFERSTETTAETLAVSFEYGRRRADAWTLVLAQEGFTIEITPDVAQPGHAYPTIGLRTSGLSAFDIVGLGHDGVVPRTGGSGMDGGSR